MTYSHFRVQLIKATRYWSLQQDFNPDNARELHRKAILLNHSHYLENIPVYRKIAMEQGIGEVTDIETVKNKLMFSDDIFKSYDPEWLYSRDFEKMNRWLSGINHHRVNMDVQENWTVDDWLGQLESIGINMTYSSGTSGIFSFVPRDSSDRAQARIANICYLVPLLSHQNTGISPGRFSPLQVANRLSPSALANIVSKIGLKDFDAFFLGFRQGKMGNQTLMQDIVPFFRKCHFLYGIDLTLSILHCLKRGARTEDEQKSVAGFRDIVDVHKDRNYLALVERIMSSTGEGQKVFIFGAPYQFQELCSVMSLGNKRITLNQGSIILFGGGWKSFAGEMVNRESLVEIISNNFGLPQESILEGYSMTEISMLMLRCGNGRFHIPPIIEPVVFDEELIPLEGADLVGTFGFMDPLAVSYPGFIITGDRVHLVDGQCECGLTGPAIIEVGRAKSRDIKGCGGIMSSINA